MKKDKKITLPIKRIPLGIGDFKEIIDKNTYFVDKTLLIKEIIDDNAKIKLILRPRRFGKTINLSMLYYFFSIYESNARIDEIFKQLSISKYHEYMKYHKKYPVIFLTLKNFNSNSYDDLVMLLKNTLLSLYRKYRNVVTKKNQIDSYEMEEYNKICSGHVEKNEIIFLLKNLISTLQATFNQRVIVLLDEYDTPLNYDSSETGKIKFSNLLSRLLLTTFKDNSSIEQAIITGITAKLKVSVLSDLNNFIVYDLLTESDRYSKYFGFEQSEVEELLVGNDVITSKWLKRIKAWYGGYQIGSIQLFNPWSIMSFLVDYKYNNKKLKACLIPRWIMTTDTYIYENILYKFIYLEKFELMSKIEFLLNGSSIKEKIYRDVQIDSLDSDPDNIWSLLFITGYLTAIKSNEYKYDYVDLIIPNRENMMFFRNIINNSNSSNIRIKGNDNVELNYISRELKYYYKTCWRDLRGLLFQVPQPIIKFYVHLELVERRVQIEKEKKLDEEMQSKKLQPEGKGKSPTTNLTLRDERLYRFEDVYNPTKQIKVEDVFKTDNKTLKKVIRKVLVIGRAGVGKSTLCQYIAYRWATKDLFKDRFNIVFWLKLQHLNHHHFHNQRSLTLADIIRMDWQIHQANRDVPSVKVIQKSLDSDKTLLILDGFDKVIHSYGKLDPFGSVLRAALEYKNVLLTTRPNCVPQYIKFDRILENIGFSDEQITRYVTKVVKQYHPHHKTASKKEAKSFSDQLKNNSNVWGIAHIPINLNLLCQFRFDKEMHFEFDREISLTRLYTKLGELLLRHYVKEKKQRKDSTLMSAQELQGLCDNELHFLEQLAFEGLISGKILISSKNVRKQIRKVEQEIIFKNDMPIKQDLLSLALETGFLMTTDYDIGIKGKTKKSKVKDKNKNTSIITTSRSYYFIHLTFQEYLAASYLVRGLNMEDTGGRYFQRTLAFIENEKYCPKYRMLFRFTAGLLSLDYEDKQVSHIEDEEQNSEADEGLLIIKKSTPFSVALCYFWDAIICSPQDLIGLQKIDLWMSCLEEAKIPGTDKIDTRIIYLGELLKELVVWVEQTIREDKTGIFNLSWQRFRVHRSLWQKLNFFVKLIEGLRDKNWKLRRAAYKLLVALCQSSPKLVLADEALMASLRSGWKDENWQVSEVATDALAVLSLDAPKKVFADNALIQALRIGWCDDDWGVRTAARRTLGALCQVAPKVVLADKRLMAILRAGWRDEVWDVRDASTRMLGAICQAAPKSVLANEELIAALFTACRDNERWVRDAALRALGALCRASPKAFLADKGLLATLYAGLRDKDANPRSVTYKALVSLCQNSPIEVFANEVLMTALRNGLHDVNSSVRKTASIALMVLCHARPNEVLADELFMASLRDGLCDVNSSVRKTASQAIVALSEASPNEVLVNQTLINNLHAGSCDNNLSVRKTTYHALAALCQARPNAVLADDVLMAILHDGWHSKDGDVRKLAYKALASLCQAIPNKVLANQALMANLHAGLRDKNLSVRKTAFDALEAFCQARPNVVLVDEALMASLHVGWHNNDGYLRRVAYKALASLCKYSPNRVSANNALMAILRAGLRDENLSVRENAFHALAALCQSSPDSVLADEKFMATLLAGWRDKVGYVRADTYQALVALCQASPNEVLANKALMAILRAGLRDENSIVSKSAQHVFKYLGTSINAFELLNKSYDTLVTIFENYFNSSYPVCIVITRSKLILQIDRQNPLEITITRDNRELILLIIKTCSDKAKKNGLPLYVFKALSENRSIVPRMLPRPYPHNARGAFLEEHQNQLQQYEQRQHHYSIASPNMLVSHNVWVVSLMRKQKSNNPEHAFLLIEGRTIFDLGVLQKIELVIDLSRPTKKLLKLGVTSGYGCVKIKSNGGIPLEKLEKIFYGEAFLNHASFFVKSWQITSNEKDQLLIWARKEQALEGTAKQMRYFIGGDKSILASLNSGFSRNGHNCFTWAAALLERLNEDMPKHQRRINIEYGKLFARTSHYVRDPNKKRSLKSKYIPFKH